MESGNKDVRSSEDGLSGIGNVDAKGGFAPSSDRPYRPDSALEGQLENRHEDVADNELLSSSKGHEEAQLRIGEERNREHGNVGFAGNYAVAPCVEK